MDDDRDGVGLVASQLERHHERIVTRVEQRATAPLRRFETGELDCIVSDYHLERTDGVSLLERVREEEPEFPFVLLTRTGNERTASEAISAGVTDYVVKGVVDDQYELLAKKVAGAVERRRAERRAARTERRLRELVGNTNDALWMFSADWSELLFVNDAYEELFGSSTESLYEDPSSFLDVVHADDRQEVLLAMERIPGGESVSVEYRIRPDEGTVRWVESHGEPIFGGGSSPTRVAGFTRDITARKEHEARLEEKTNSWTCSVRSSHTTSGTP